MSNAHLRTYLLLFGLLLGACTPAPSPPALRWYEQTKAALLQVAELPIDSTRVVWAPDSQRHLIEYFSEGIVLWTEHYQQGKLAAQTLHSRNGQFELRREGCEDRRIAFEGLVFEDAHYGLARWWYCNGMLSEQGMRFRDVKVGRWEYYNRIGDLVKTEYHGPTDSLAFLPVFRP